MINILYISAAVMVFVAVLLFGQFAYWSYQTRKESESQELSRRLGVVADRTLAPLLRLRTDRKGMGAYLDDMLRQAGSPYPLESLYNRMVFWGVAGALLGVIVLRNPFGLTLGIAGYIPVLLVSSEAQRRARKLTEQLPEGLDLISRSLQAGHGISEAMRMVAEETPLPLAQELGRVYEEHNLGRDFRECLENLVRRNPGNFDLQIFVSSVLLQRDTGGNLVEILGNISSTIRSRFIFEGKVRALTSEARFTGWVLGGLPFFVILFLVFMAPAYLSPLFTDPLGIGMVVFAAFWFLIGVFIMREISKVDV